MLTPNISNNVFPLWFKIINTLFCLIMVSVYTYMRGPASLLWFSDIALVMIVLALWKNSGLIASISALNVLLFEIGWNIDYFSRLLFGTHLFGMDATAYMYNPDMPIQIKSISLILHIYLPPALIFMLYRLGYHPQAWKGTLLLTWVVLPACFLFTSPESNVNWVYGIGDIQIPLSGWPYLFTLMLVVPLLIYLPSHFLLRYIFGPQKFHRR